MFLTAGILLIQLCHMFYEAAKMLGVKQFGMVIYNTIVSFDSSQVYDTETFKMN